jgi:hypothetical protein
MTRHLHLAFIIFLCACRPNEPPDVDLVPPTIMETEPRAGGEVSPTGPIRIRFSEPMDPATLTLTDAVALVPHRDGGACSTDLSCTEGRCHSGRCQRDLVDSAFVADMANPPLSSKRRAGLVPVTVTLDAAGSEATVELSRPLAPRRRHTLLVGPGVSDLAGNPLARAAGERLGLRSVLVAKGAGSGRPVVRLASPPAGEADLPTNLGRLVVRFSEAVSGVTATTLGLVDAAGRRVAARVNHTSRLCVGNPPGSCFEIELLQRLSPRTIYDLDVGAFVAATDDGQPAMLMPGQQLATGDRYDSAPPRIDSLRHRTADGCIVARLRTEDATDLWMDGTWCATAPASVGALQHEVALPTPVALSTATVVIRDLAGNQATTTVPADPVAAPGVVLTEVLQNPAGPEPAQEYVELLNLGSQAVDLAGWQLDDGDDGVGVNLLPAGKLAPGRRAVVVGKGYKPGSLDPSPVSGALLVRLDRALGDSGLSNAGEVIVLRDPQGRVVSAYSNQLGSASGKSFEGRSVQRVDPSRCDVRSNWRFAKATPGW